MHQLSDLPQKNQGCNLDILPRECMLLDNNAKHKICIVSPTFNLWAPRELWFMI